MLRSLKDLEGYTIAATDGDVGRVVDFLLDDERWAIRYMVVETGGFLDGRRVLVTPISLGTVDWSSRRVHLALTVDKIKNSPSIDTDKPVSRQHERDFHRYYGYPYYWGDLGLWGIGAYPNLLAPGQYKEAAVERPDDASADVHLRSAKEVRGYDIQGSDKAIGHLEDFIVDDENWALRYLVVDTRNWWFGKKVLVAPQWASSVSWNERKVYVDVSRDFVKNSPEWNTVSIDREYETRLHDYHGRAGYWSV